MMAFRVYAAIVVLLAVAGLSIAVNGATIAAAPSEPCTPYESRMVQLISAGYSPFMLLARDDAGGTEYELWRDPATGQWVKISVDRWCAELVERGSHLVVFEIAPALPK